MSRNGWEEEQEGQEAALGRACAQGLQPQPAEAHKCGSAFGGQGGEQEDSGLPGAEAPLTS